MKPKASLLNLNNCPPECYCQGSYSIFLMLFSHRWPFLRMKWLLDEEQTLNIPIGPLKAFLFLIKIGIFFPSHIMRSWHHRSEIVGVSLSLPSSGNSLLLLDLKVIGLSYFSLCCLFITALGTSRKTILLGGLSYFHLFRSFISFVLLKNVKG